MATYYDLVIIGAGPGGYTAAIKGASFGMKVAVVDEEESWAVSVSTGAASPPRRCFMRLIFFP